MSVISSTTLKSPPERRRLFVVTVVGLSLLLGYGVQLLLGVSWTGLVQLQQRMDYKLVTGFALGGLIAFQWSLSLSRVQLSKRLAKRLYRWHQYAGAVSPLVFFAHSVELGAGCVLALSVVFLGNHLLGLLSPRLLPQLKPFAGPWMVGHVATSVLLVSLMLYHVWTALYYE